MRNIVIVGCGFAGYHATRRLEQKLGSRRRVNLTVVTRRPTFVFTPLLSAVAGGQIDAGRITLDADQAFSSRVDVITDDIETIDFDAGQLISSHDTIPFDYLLLATGSHRNPSAFDGAQALRGPDNLDDAVDIRRQFQGLSTDQGPLRLTVIGGSTTGVEWAGRLATGVAEAKHLRSDGVQIEVLEQSDRLLPDHSPRISDKVTEYLESLNIDIHLDTAVQSADADRVVLDGGQTRPTDWAFHCAGRIGASVAPNSSLPTDDARRVIVDDDLSIGDRNGVFAAGDAALHRTTPNHSNPQIAMQQGLWAARNLLADMSGRATRPFEFDDRGDFITVGPDKTALELGGLLLEGRAAWLAYRLYYTALMPRPIQNTNVLGDWIRRRLSDGSSQYLPDDTD